MKRKIARFIYDFKRELLSNSISILGLSIGLTTVILTSCWAMFEYSYDRFNDDFEKIYCVNARILYKGKKMQDNTLGSAYYLEAPKMMPEIESAAMVCQRNATLISYGTKKVMQNGIVAVSSNFFSFFTYPFLYGDPTSCLEKINHVVIDRETAIKIFGALNVIGKNMTYRGHLLQVSGVIENMPRNSHLQVHMLFNRETLYKFNPKWIDSWVYNDMFATYYKLGDHVDKNKLAKKIEAEVYDHCEGAKTFKIEVYLSSLEAQHLYNDENSIVAKQIHTLGFLSIIILIIACVNFSNVFISISILDGKRVALYKLFGASRWHIMYQYFKKVLVYVVIATIIALFMSYHLTSLFNEVFHADVELDFGNPSLWGLLLGAILFTTFISVLYPALWLSNYSIIDILSGRFRKVGKNVVQYLFMILQFVISIAFMIYVMGIERQLEFIESRNVGLKKENVIYFHAANNPTRCYEYFSQEAKRDDHLKEVCFASTLPSFFMSGNMAAPITDKENQFLVEQKKVSKNYMEFFGIEMTGQRFGSTVRDKSVIVNESMVHKLNLKEPLNKPFYLGDNKYIIQGVVKGIHYNYTDMVQYPVLYLPVDESQIKRYFTIMVRVDNESKENLQLVNTIWHKLEPNLDIYPSYLSESFGRLYQSQKDQRRMFSTAMVLAFLLSILGMFAMANLSVVMRQREFAIRRVNGATSRQIFLLQWFSFMKPIIISYVIALPIAYLFIERFLEDFALKVTIGIGVYLITALIVLFTTFVTVFYQGVKASRTNPIEVLRYE
ncbi:ABC transporter permease [Halosquirtibacter xylanolyticus]|uniref:ABC transporter permease n=1 Tax=Halosquirtibacter xylanolyticus TaxID=3374599 RepID=UPI00374A6A73|nr:ABC transporter permease [Prolixibacteraceae bacterium]